LTWFVHPPVKANGMNVTTTGRPRKLARLTFWSVCDASVKSGAALPVWTDISVSPGCVMPEQNTRVGEPWEDP